MTTPRDDLLRVLDEETSAFRAKVEERVVPLLDEAARAASGEEGGKIVRRHSLVDVKANVLRVLEAAKAVEASKGIAFGEIRAHNLLRRVSEPTVRQALTDLRNEGAIAMTGQRRTALYHLIDRAVSQTAS